MLTKVKACANFLIPLIGVMASVLFMGVLPKFPKIFRYPNGYCGN